MRTAAACVAAARPRERDRSKVHTPCTRACLADCWCCVWRLAAALRHRTLETAPAPREGRPGCATPCMEELAAASAVRDTRCRHAHSAHCSQGHACARSQPLGSPSEILEPCRHLNAGGRAHEDGCRRMLTSAPPPAQAARPRSEEAARGLAGASSSPGGAVSSAGEGGLGRWRAARREERDGWSD